MFVDSQECVYAFTTHQCTIFPHRPLHVAARNGLTMVVQELLGKGASVLAVDENGKQAPWPSLGQLLGGSCSLSMVHL